MSQAARTVDEDAKFRRVCDVVAEEMRERPIPGVVVGVLHGDSMSIRGFGVTSVEHPLPVDAATLCQIGSVTKTFTATALMRLVERGVLDVDAPLRTYLPDLQLRDERVAAHVTLRHLLTHTGGWVGDYFEDTGPGEDALARMVRQVGTLPQLTPVGEIYSYNNAGFYIAGRVVEIAAGKPYAAALHELILDPLGLEHAYLSAGDVITHRFVVGHHVVAHTPRVARPWAMPRSIGPVGGIIADMGNLLRYARFHMGDGTVPDGTGERLLASESLASMQTPLYPASGDEWVGLSWFMQDVDGTRILRHNGGTKGQQVHLSVIPQAQFALGIFTNSEEGSTIYDGVRRAAYAEYLGLHLPQHKSLPAMPEQLAVYVGRYAAAMDDCAIGLENGSLVLHITEKGGFPTPETPPPPQQPPPMRLALYAEDRIVVLDGPDQNAVGEFIRDAHGRVAWFRYSGRVHARTSD